MTSSKLSRSLSFKLAALPLALAEVGGHRRRSRGFGLLEIIGVTALGAVVAGVGYTVYVHNRRTEEVAQSVQSAQSLGQAIQASYSSSADYSGLNQQSAMRENLFDRTSLNAAGQPKNPWGGDILVAPTTVNSHPGFAITYEKVPQANCARLATQGAAAFSDVKINGQSVLDYGKPDTASAINLCAQSDSNTVQFVRVKQALTLRSNPSLTPCEVQPDQTRQVACPSGQISSVSPYGVNGITQQRSSFCNSAYGTLGWTAWQNVTSTCAPICTPPAPQATSQNLTGSCPSGSYVAGTTNTTFPQTQAGTITYTCPAPTGGYTTNPTTWGAITPSAASVCAPACVAPAASSTSGTQTASCPSGQVTSSGATTFTQTRSGTISYSCPSPTGAYTTNPTSWGAWSPAASSVCAPACSAPATSNTLQYHWVTVNVGCPSGYTGSHTYQKQQKRTATTTYSCASPTGSYTTNPTTYSGWTDTGAIKNNQNTCVASPPSTRFMWVRDEYGSSFQYEPSASRNQEDVYYQGAAKPGCYTCYDNGTHQCDFLAQLNSCSCTSTNNEAWFDDRYEQAGTGYGDDIMLCLDCNDPNNKANYRDCQ